MNKYVKKRLRTQFRNRSQLLTSDHEAGTDCKDKEERLEQKSEVPAIGKAYVQAAEEVIGYKKVIEKPWIRQGTWSLIEQMKSFKQKMLNSKTKIIKDKWLDEYRNKNKEVKKELRCI